MEEVTAAPVQSVEVPKKPAGALQVIWFLTHLAAVYIIVNSVTPWLAGWTGHTFLPGLQITNESSSNEEFFFSHLFVFCFVPTLVAGFNNLKFKHRVAEYAWVVPGMVLAYKLATFSVATSVLAHTSVSAFHQYFGSDFFVPQYHNWQEFWEIVRSNPDMTRGLAQVQFTGPFYAGVGYSLGASISLRTNPGRRIVEMFKKWEEERFGSAEADAMDEGDLTGPNQEHPDTSQENRAKSFHGISPERGPEE